MRSAGRAAVRPGQSACTDCPINSYSSDSGSQFCAPCDIYTSSDAGATSCLKPSRLLLPWIIAGSVLCGVFLVWSSCRCYNYKLDRDLLRGLPPGTLQTAPCTPSHEQSASFTYRRLQR